MEDDERAMLEAELLAIELCDDIYRLDTSHNEIDEVAYRRRQERREEIMREIR